MANFSCSDLRSFGWLESNIGYAVAMVMDAIDVHIERLFVQVLQLDARTLRLEALEINDE